MTITTSSVRIRIRYLAPRSFPIAAPHRCQRIGASKDSVIVIAPGTGRKTPRKESCGRLSTPTKPAKPSAPQEATISSATGRSALDVRQVCKTEHEKWLESRKGRN
jgi:hypothetical protein